MIKTILVRLFLIICYFVAYVLLVSLCDMGLNADNTTVNTFSFLAVVAITLLLIYGLYKTIKSTIKIIKRK